MATIARRAPKMAREQSSMAAASAALIANHQPVSAAAGLGFASAWASVWSDLAGAVYVTENGDRLIGASEPGQAAIAAGLGLSNDDQVRGAMNVMRALLDRAGPDARDAIFAQVKHDGAAA